FFPTMARSRSSKLDRATRSRSLSSRARRSMSRVKSSTSSAPKAAAKAAVRQAPTADSEGRTSATAACPVCSSSTPGLAWQRYRVCDVCRYHHQLTANERIELLTDPDSFKPSSSSLVSVDPLVFTDRISYRDRLERARRETGLNEAVVTGTARVNGYECVLAVFDFNFMGGSMGSVVGEKVALALELAAERRIPFISVVATGGARMQEGMLSLVQMAKTTAAA